MNLSVSSDCVFQVKNQANRAIDKIYKLIDSKTFKNYEYKDYYKDLIKNFRKNSEKYVMSKSLKKEMSIRQMTQIYKSRNHFILFFLNRLIKIKIAFYVS